MVRRDSNILFNGNVTEIFPSLHLAQGTERVGCGTTDMRAMPTIRIFRYSDTHELRRAEGTDEVVLSVQLIHVAICW